MALTKVKKQVLDTLNPPLSAESGGTGLAAPGTSGNVLTSNGSGWTSAALVGGIGVGQTWQNVLSQRIAGTTYTNNTGKPILVLITVGPSTAANILVVIVNGVTIYETGQSTWDNSAQASFIVPDGNTYRITTASSVRTWSELR